MINNNSIMNLPIHAKRRPNRMFFVVAGLLLIWPILAGATAPAASASRQFPGPYLQTQYVMHLENLGLIHLLDQAVKAHRGTPSAPLFQSGLIYARWASLAKHPQQQAALAPQFVADVRAYLDADSNATLVDAGWAVNQAKFLFAYIVPPMADRIEYWSSTAVDRARLAPVAKLSSDLLNDADQHYKKTIADLNLATTFTHADELAYQQAMSGQAQVSYYLAYANYYTGLSLAPADATRKTILDRAVALAQKWIHPGPASGVYYQALLLAGKAHLQAAEYAAAITSLQKAQLPVAPLWVQYQSRYQQTVAMLKSGHLRQATTTVNAYEAWIHSEKTIDSPGAIMGAQLLRYRILNAQAGMAGTPPAEKIKLTDQAATLALKIISTAPQYEQLIFSHLAGKLPTKPDFAQLSPLQSLAYAWLHAQKKNKANNVTAVKAVDAILARKGVNPSIRREALLIGGISNFRLGRLTDAIKLNLEFVKSDPHDARAPHVLNLALYDIKQLSPAAQTSTEVSALISQALHLAYFTYHEKKWAFAYATQLQQSGHLNQAMSIFSKIGPSNPFYLDARYEIVRIGTIRLAQLAAKKAPAEQQRRQARLLLRICGQFLTLLKNPPASLSPSDLKRAKGYRQDVWLIQAGTALDPLHNPNRAAKALTHLDSIRAKLSPRLQGVVLRYRIRQYQLQNRGSRILPLVEQYAKESSQKATDIIEGLIGQYDRESRNIRDSQPLKARRLAADAAVLMQQLIKHLQKAAKPKTGEIYVYRQLLADELIRAGHGHQAMAIFKKLEQEKPQDLENFIGVARSAYATADYNYAHSLYVRIIPQLKPGSTLFWSAYLYLIRSNQAMGKNQEATRSSLKSLNAIYGASIGGKYFHKQFEKLLASYTIN